MGESQTPVFFIHWTSCHEKLHLFSSPRKFWTMKINIHLFSCIRLVTKRVVLFTREYSWDHHTSIDFLLRGSRDNFIYFLSSIFILPFFSTFCQYFPRSVFALWFWFATETGIIYHDHIKLKGKTRPMLSINPLVRIYAQTNLIRTNPKTCQHFQ